MRPLPFSDGVASGVFFGAYVVFMVIEIRIGIRSKASTAGDHDHGSKRLALGLIWIGMVAAFSLAASVPAASIRGPRWLCFAVGIKAMLTGTALRQWAITTLGRFFTLEVRIADDQTIIEGGPYRWVRHPAYSSSLLTFAGLGLALGNWLAVVVVVILPLTGYVRRIHVEERALHAAFGDAYARYATSRRRLIPGVW